MIEGLFQNALADGALHANEERYLFALAQLFGVTNIEFASVRARQMCSGTDRPYGVLGATPEIDDEALKTRYRKLIGDYDPDTMLARGVPRELISIATKKIATVDAAYETIAKERELTR